MNQTSPEVPRKDWAGIRDGAERFAISKTTIRRLIASGQLTAYRIGPRLIRIDLNELERVLQPIPTAGGPSAA